MPTGVVSGELRETESLKHSAASAEAGPILLFDRKAEIINLVVPLFFIAGSVVELSYRLRFGSVERVIGSYLVNLVLFNFLHTFLGFGLLVALPEFRSWVLETTRKEPRKFWLQTFGVFTLLFLVFVDPGSLLSQTPFFPLLFSFLIAARVHHTVSQHFGLSKIYNSKHLTAGGGSEELRKRIQTLDRMERLGFRSLLTFNVSAVLLNYIAIKFGSSLNPYRIYWHWLVWCAIGGTAMSALFILISNSLLKGTGRSTKFLFLLRLPLYPLAHLSTTASLGLQAAHGVEYVGVYRKMLGNSSLEDAGRRRLLYAILAMCLIGCALVVLKVGFEHPASRFEETPSSHFGIFSRVGGALALAWAYLHYYLDRQIFRMRKPVNREIVLPLLSR